MDKIMATANPVISTQVLQEFYHAATSKLGVDKLLAKRIVHNLQNMTVVQITPALIEQGIDISITAKLSFWDGAEPAFRRVLTSLPPQSMLTVKHFCLKICPTDKS
jgi:hypothetical protein